MNRFEMLDVFECMNVCVIERGIRGRNCKQKLRIERLMQQEKVRVEDARSEKNVKTI